jgi:glucose-6-phosphate isomerase
MIKPWKILVRFFTDTFETEEILANFTLLKKWKKGHRQAELWKGQFVGLAKAGSSGDAK